MEAFLIYLAKAAAATAAFFLLHLMLFNKRKQFRFNRFYLAGSLVISMLIPLVTITVTREAAHQLVLLPVQAGATAAEVAADSGTGFSLTLLLLLVYLAGVLFFLVHLVMGHFRVLQIARKSRQETYGGISIFVTREDVHPFTFFGKIIVPNESTSQPYFPMILNHEKIHADGHHTLDILLSEMLFLVQWFNPFAWLLKDAVKNNLEYLTDQEVTRRADLSSYQMALVALANKRGITPFLNALNGNDLKNRIIMMKQKTENRNSVIRKLMVLPLTALLITGLSAREYKTVPSSEPLGSFTTETLTEPSGLPAEDLQDGPIRQQGALLPESGPTDAETVKTGMLPADTVVASKVTLITGSPKSFNIDAGEMVVANLGKNAGQVIRVSNMEAVTGRDTLRIRTIGGKEGPQPLFIVDGQPVSSMDHIDPKDIESITVLKNESSTALYGEKGKNGVILVTTKKGSSDKDETQPSSAGKKAAQSMKSTDWEDALILIDGKESTTPLTEINPDDIATMNVLKGEVAKVKFGPRGERGVVEIVTQKGAAASDSKVTIVEKKSSSTGMGTPITSEEGVRQVLAQSVKYPVKAQESGLQGEVIIYAFVNGEGEITQITEMKPGVMAIAIGEIVVVAYGPKEGEKPLPGGNGKKDILNQEAALQVKQLPALQIPEYYNKWVMFRFKFALQ